MKENEKIMKKTHLYNTQHNLSEEELVEINQEDKEIYLFLRGGFTAK